MKTNENVEKVNTLVRSSLRHQNDSWEAEYR